MCTIDQNDITRIRQLNDALRITGEGGAVMMTAGVATLPIAEREAVLAAVRSFSAFTADNDPYGEHDFASLRISDHSIIWKIDYYDLQMTGHSPDPADPAQTKRVLTIMLSDEY